MSEPLVALYARVSTEEQAKKYGLIGQLRELRDYAAAHGYRIAYEFVDDGVSGATLERPGLERLRAVVRDRGVQVVVMHDPDRLARRLALQLLLDDEFRRAGVRLEFVTVQTDGSAEGDLLLNVKGVVAEYERLKIRERTMRGRREKALRGKVPLGKPAFGYRVDPTTPSGWAIDAAAAAVLRQMTTWCLDGMSLRAMVRQLRALAIPTKLGGVWSVSTVREMLTSPTYLGTLTWRTGSQAISIAVPPLRTKAEHAAILEALRGRSGGQPPKQVYLLRGLLVCPCGGRMHGDRWMYTCGNLDHVNVPKANPAARARCVRRINRRDVEARVWQQIESVLRDPARLEAAVTAAQPVLAARRAPVALELDAGQAAVAAVARKRAKLLDLFLGDVIDSETFRAKDAPLTTALRAAEQRVVAAKIALAADAGTTSLQTRIIRTCRRVARSLKRLGDDDRQRVVAGLLERIDIQPTGSLILIGALPLDPEKRATQPLRTDRAITVGRTP
jgi:site-specific DNA recombinase